MGATALVLDGTKSARPALMVADGSAFARESFLAEHLPYFSRVAEDVLILREGDLMATLRLDGLNPMTTPDGELDALRRAVAAIVAQTGDLFGFYVHRIAVPQDLSLQPIEGDSFAAEIDRRWQRGPVTELFRSFDLVFCRKGETTWHRNQPLNSAQKRFVLR